MSSEYDIAIVGGGPAGSSLAIRLALSGRRVLLFEQKRFPRAKLCGEFVSPECLGHLDELGVIADIRSVDPAELKRTVFYSRSGRSVEFDNEWFGSKSAIGLSRAELDHQLLERAKSAGVKVLEDRAVSGPAVEGNKLIGINIRSGDHEEYIAAPITVDATGRARSVARHLDAQRKLEKPTHVAFKAHIRGAAVEEGVCEIFSYLGGYGGCNAVEGGLYNLCFIASAGDVRKAGSEPARVLREVVSGNTRAAAVMAGASVETDWLAVPITRFGSRDPVPADGLLAVGDAASFIDPFTGSGILMALESSRIAAEAIISGKEFSEIARAYRSAHAAAFDDRLGVSRIIRNAAYIPRLADAVIAVLSLSPSLRRRLARATRAGRPNV